MEDGPTMDWWPLGAQARPFWEAQDSETWPQYCEPAPCPDLPMHDMREQTLDLIRQHPIVILKGETGSGKSTQLPQFLLAEQPWEHQVTVAQPRRMAAIALAEGVAHERGELPGASVGYQVGGEAILPWAYGSICFCTEGSLL